MEELKKELHGYICGISEVDHKAMQEAKDYSADLLKIPMSLGKIEEIAFKLSAITGKVHNELKKKCIIIMSADNGIVAQGVSSAPKSVTKTMTECFSKYVTGVGATAKIAGSDLIIYDIGVDAEISDPNVINKKIKYGTDDMTIGPAMSNEEAIKAILVGVKAVENAKASGYQVIGTGEMGIGNTSSSTAVICALSGADVSLAVGNGTGMVDDNEYLNKVNMIKKALEINKPDPSDPLDVLAKVGGLDIAGLVGIYLGCAYYKLPVVIDGYISSAAFYLAYKLNNKVRDYAFESHLTEEKGYKYIQNDIKLEPMFNLNMRLGEGSGCPFTFFAMDCAESMMNTMYTFQQGMISDEYVNKVNDLKF